MGPVRSASSGVAAYKRVARRVEPVSESICRSFSKDLPAQFCDFQIRFDDNPKAAPHAYQTIGKDGKPIITFNVNMLRSIKNDDEIAFIMGHEAGHQIARHLLQKRNNANGGAILGAIIIGGLGGNPMDGANLGGMVGAQSFSKKFELQADRIGAHVATRSGYNAIRGARSFERTGGSNSMLSTHPPGADRFAVVQRTVAEINAARKQGKTAPIRW
jgi:Zn-dependent protease with chaperone function